MNQNIEREVNGVCVLITRRAAQSHSFAHIYSLNCMYLSEANIIGSFFENLYNEHESSNSHLCLGTGSSNVVGGETN